MTEPLKAELMGIEREISDQIELNAATKSSVLENEEKILKMIRTVRHQKLLIDRTDVCDVFSGNFHNTPCPTVQFILP